MPHDQKNNQTTPAHASPAAAYNVGSMGIARPAVVPSLQMKEGELSEETLSSQQPDKAPLQRLANRPASQKGLPPSTSTQEPVVQRVISLNGGFIHPTNYQAFLLKMKEAFDIKGYTWMPQHAQLLTEWLQEHDRIISANDIEAIADDLFMHGANEVSWAKMNATAIPAADMAAAQNRRKRERAASLLEPSTVQTTKSATGIKNLDDTQLLRLTDLEKKEEDEFWIRRPDNSLNVAKKRKLAREDEARIVASGHPNKPSYVVWKDNHQLGHFYSPFGGRYNHGAEKDRTYGSKEQREGYKYKGTGLVDGHSVQAQDDQHILGPFRSEASHWTTTPKTMGTPDPAYDDSKYLPQNATEKKFIEKHPYNNYWENQEQGKHFRQKGIEMRALNDDYPFLHLNHYKGDTFQPNAGAKMQNIYDVPDRVHYLLKDPGQQRHLKADNRPVADYSKPDDYNKATNRYKDINGPLSHLKNKSLGNKSAREHVELAAQADTSQFPFSTVLKPKDPTFSYEPESRFEDEAYTSPPPSPMHISAGIDEKKEVVTENRTELQDFMYNQRLVEKADYDQVNNKTELTLSALKKESEPSSWVLPIPSSSTVTGASIPTIQGASYFPTTQQDQELTNATLKLHWIVPDGHCIFGAWGASNGEAPNKVQQTVADAIKNNTGNIRNWIEHNYGGHKWEDVLKMVIHIEHYWATGIADLMLNLVAEVYKEGATIIDPTGAKTIISGGGARTLLKVTNPHEHYHAATM
ncbi:hypothetical protein [Chitinophaga sp.]|uniref:hypothetical protein n=1 Tax=Chitinophaga sp. TaxID=1869181 RepID=UPI002F95E73F